MDETVRTKLIEQYKFALERLELSQRYKTEAEKLTRFIETAPERIKKLRGQLEQAKKSDITERALPTDLSEDATSEELDKRRVIQPKKGIFENILSANPKGWLSRMTWLWYPAAILLPISLAGLAVFGYYYVASKNLPGVIEITILRNLPIQKGSRYAITSISQYILVIIGLIIISKILGVNWLEFGWLFAALSVGIVLFLERPIRVGDVVTVSDVSGIVTKIQIRATTILKPIWFPVKPKTKSVLV